MENPQKENGYTAIANEIMDALCTVHLSAYESRILWVILRKTYGFNKKEDWISLSQFEQTTGLSKPHICRALKMLKDQHLIAEGGNDGLPKGARKVMFNKYYSQWRALPKGARSHHHYQRGQSPITKGGNEVLPKGAHTKERSTKVDVLQKNICAPEIVSEFDEFLRWLNAKDEHNRYRIFPNEKAPTDLARRKWETRRLKYPARKIAEAFANLVNEPDKWKINNNGHRPLAWWLHSDERIEDMLACHLKCGINTSKAPIIFPTTR